MKVLTIILKVLLILFILATGACFVIVYTKPSEQECIERGKEIVDLNSAKRVPGFYNMNDTTLDSAAIASPQLIVVKDKIFWKEIYYTWNDNTKLLAYGYLDSIYLPKR